jgi:hypothetical protein
MRLFLLYIRGLYSQNSDFSSKIILQNILQLLLFYDDYLSGNILHLCLKKCAPFLNNNFSDFPQKLVQIFTAILVYTMVIIIGLFQTALSLVRKFTQHDYCLKNDKS